MTWLNRVLWLVMFRVENWASTCANHTSGSVGQNGGIFTETADTEAGGYGSWVAEGEEKGSRIFSAILLSQGHQV